MIKLLFLIDDFVLSSFGQLENFIFPTSQPFSEDLVGPGQQQELEFQVSLLKQDPPPLQKLILAGRIDKNESHILTLQRKLQQLPSS